MSTHYKFPTVCDGEKVLGMLCTTVWEVGTFNSPAGVSQSWLDARNHGWRIVTQQGTDRHLCPSCFKTYLAKKDRGMDGRGR